MSSFLTVFSGFQILERNYASNFISRASVFQCCSPKAEYRSANFSVFPEVNFHKEQNPALSGAQITIYKGRNEPKTVLAIKVPLAQNFLCHLHQAVDKTSKENSVTWSSIVLGFTQQPEVPLLSHNPFLQRKRSAITVLPERRVMTSSRVDSFVGHKDSKKSTNYIVLVQKFKLSCQSWSRRWQLHIS